MVVGLLLSLQWMTDGRARVMMLESGEPQLSFLSFASDKLT